MSSFTPVRVNPALLDYAKGDCAIYDSAKMTLEEVIAVMAPAARAGKTVVRLHTGDPCVYGAHREQMDALDRLGLAYEVCPGVSSFCGAAAGAREGITKTALITVGGFLGDSYDRSKMYDPAFTTGFREASR